MWFGSEGIGLVDQSRTQREHAAVDSGCDPTGPAGSDGPGSLTLSAASLLLALPAAICHAELQAKLG